jgi:hypothetical protein
MSDKRRSKLEKILQLADKELESSRIDVHQTQTQIETVLEFGFGVGTQIVEEYKFYLKPISSGLVGLSIHFSSMTAIYRNILFNVDGRYN